MMYLVLGVIVGFVLNYFSSVRIVKKTDEKRYSDYKQQKLEKLK